MSTDGIFVPEILRGCQFIGVEDHGNFTSYVFLTNDKTVLDGVIRVSIVIKGPITYIYTIVDRETNTIRHYHGPYGDPAKDTWDEVKTLD